MTIDMIIHYGEQCLKVEFDSFNMYRGEGVPTGGKKGQVLKKSGDGDFETEWGDDIAGQGGTIVSVGGKPVSTFDADTKLDAQSIPSTVYGVSGGGKQTYYHLSKASLGDTIPQRNYDGTIYVESGTHEFSAVNLKQLNEVLAEQVGDISTALDTLHEYAQALVNGGAN